MTRKGCRAAVLCWLLSVFWLCAGCAALALWWEGGK